MKVLYFKKPGVKIQPMNKREVTVEVINENPGQNPHYYRKAPLVQVAAACGQRTDNVCNRNYNDIHHGATGGCRGIIGDDAKRETFCHPFVRIKKGQTFQQVIDGKS